MEEIITKTPGIDDISVTVSQGSTSASAIPDISISSTPSDKFEFSTVVRWIIIILIVAFLGFNIFTYLGKATDITTGIFGPIIHDITSFFANLFGETTKTAVDISSKGIKFGTDIAAGTVKSGVDVLQGTLGGKQTRNKIDDNTEDIGSDEDEEDG